MIELTQSHRALPDAEATANLLLWFANDLPGRITALRESIAEAVRANRTGGDTTKLLEAAKREARVSKGLFNLLQKQTVRRVVLAIQVRREHDPPTQRPQIERLLVRDEPIALSHHSHWFIVLLVDHGPMRRHRAILPLGISKVNGPQLDGK